MTDFKFPLGSRVDVFDGGMRNLLVIGQVIYLDGSRGYICSGSSLGQGSVVRHVMNECELVEGKSRL